MGFFFPRLPQTAIHATAIAVKTMHVDAYCMKKQRGVSSSIRYFPHLRASCTNPPFLLHILDCIFHMPRIGVHIHRTPRIGKYRRFYIPYIATGLQGAWLKVDLRQQFGTEFHAVPLFYSFGQKRHTRAGAYPARKASIKLPKFTLLRGLMACASGQSAGKKRRELRLPI